MSVRLYVLASISVSVPTTNLERLVTKTLNEDGPILRLLANFGMFGACILVNLTWTVWKIRVAQCEAAWKIRR